MSAIPWKARLLTVIVILSNVSGNLLLSMGMKGSAGFVEAVLSPLVFTGVALLILWTITRVTLLSWADLSYVLPVTAIGYVLSAATGAFILHEYVSPTRWLATLLIVAGTVLASNTPHRTTAEQQR